MWGERDDPGARVQVEQVGQCWRIAIMDHEHDRSGAALEGRRKDVWVQVWGTCEGYKVWGAGERGRGGALLRGETRGSALESLTLPAPPAVRLTSGPPPSHSSHGHPILLLTQPMITWTRMMPPPSPHPPAHPVHDCLDQADVPLGAHKEHEVKGGLPQHAAGGAPFGLWVDRSGSSDAAAAASDDLTAGARPAALLQSRKCDGRRQYKLREWQFSDGA